MQAALFQEIVSMAIPTIRTQKARSGLTILGIVIGITSIVGMTSLIRGFDESFRDMIRNIGPDTVFVSQFSGVSLMAGSDLNELLQRPTLTPSDARAIERQAETVAAVNLTLGSSGGPASTRTRIHYRGERTNRITISGSTANWPDVFRANLAYGRFYT